MTTQYYLIYVWGDVDPSLLGPYATQEDSDAAARQTHEESSDDGLFWLEITDGVPSIGPFSGAFFTDDDEEEDYLDSNGDLTEAGLMALLGEEVA